MSAADDRTDELVRRTRRDWWVYNPTTGGIAYSADDVEHDARLRAEQWLKTCGPEYELRLVEYEWFSTPMRQAKVTVIEPRKL